MKSNPTILPTAIALLALFAFLAIPVEGIIPLDNTCSFGSNYIQMVGFACIAAEEEIRDPTWTGRWRVHGTYQMSAFRIINKKMNEIGIDIGGTKYCSNFTVRASKTAFFVGWPWLPIPALFRPFRKRCLTISAYI